MAGVDEAGVNCQWDVVCRARGIYTIQSRTHETYATWEAGSQSDSHVCGRKTGNDHWTIKRSMSIGGGYTIRKAKTSLRWSFTENKQGASIILDDVSDDPKSRWFFHKCQ